MRKLSDREGAQACRVVEQAAGDDDGCDDDTAEDDDGGDDDGVDRQLVRMGYRLLVRGCKGL